MLLQIRSAEFKYGGTTIFNDVNLDVNEGDSIGIVGANGAGKSTLLSCIADEQRLFSGEIYRKNGLTLGYLKQNCDFTSSNTLFDEMMLVFAHQTHLVEEIARIAEQMAACAFDSEQYRALANKYQRLTVEADVTEAYQSEVKVKTVINGMGMSAFSDRIVSTLSGGEKTKAALCKLLLQRPELMILDEPTNHLDYKTLDWLESFLSDKKSTLLVVSHDRYFLDKLCTSIWDVQHGKIHSYNGNYTKYKVLKAERLENERRAYERQQKEIEKLTDYVERNKVRASTADMAKSREKALDRMVKLDAPKNDERPPRFKFECGSDPSEFPLTIQNLTLGYDGKTLLDKAELQIRRGQKVALLGLNGAGKSTLIRRIAAQNPYDAGKITFGKNVRMGFYDQENVNLQGDLRVIDQLWFDNTRMLQTDVRNLLAQVTLGADDVYKLVKELSGGERAKLGLAMIMAKDNNLLLLDEPTNHLDLPSRESLEDALKAYEGTLLFVSHDRYFVNSVSDRIAELQDKKILVHEGNYDDFINRKQPTAAEVQNKAQTNASSNASTNAPNNSYKNNSSAKNGGTYRSAKQRAEETNRARRVKELETLISRLEAEAEQLNQQMATPQIAADYSNLSQVMEQLAAVNAQLEAALSEWEQLAT